jgi:hypothetical protein
MLARLISARQVVLLCDNSNVHLFYRGKVYSRRTEYGPKGLPGNKQAHYYPVWALIEVECQAPPISGSSNIWPIQMSSPNPAQWKLWCKNHRAAVLGMPLWNMEELMEGYVVDLSTLSAIELFDRGSLLTALCLCCSLRLQVDYDDFRSRLEQSLPLLYGPAPPVTNDEPIDAALEVLQRDEDLVDQAGQPWARVDNVDDALKILVHNATEEFGYAPIDVYEGVFHFPRTRERHATAVKNLDCSKLKALVQKFSQDLGLDHFSHHVVVVYPRPSLIDYDDWVLDFKSVQIAREVMGSIWLREDKNLQEAYNLLRKIWRGSTLAGQIFKAIFHRMLSGGWHQPDVPTLQPVCMFSDEREPPTFSTKPPSSATNTLLQSPTPQRMGTKASTSVNFAHDLSDVTLDSDKYYIPTVSNHPLFDSFTIDFNRHTTTISVFQATTSAKHEGSANDYTYIHKIMIRVCELLKQTGSDATVKVRYFLVCPDDGPQYPDDGPQHRAWQMPVGWGLNVEAHDHRGDACCIRLPVSVLHGTSCRFNPDFTT